MREPSVPPTFPDPMTPIFMGYKCLLGNAAGPLGLLLIFIHPLDDAVRGEGENRNRHDHDEKGQQ